MYNFTMENLYSVCVHVNTCNCGIDEVMQHRYYNKVATFSDHNCRLDNDGGPNSKRPRPLVSVL